MTDMRWSSRFLSERKQAEHYRAGRVFIAGDAAHVHSPLGGQGMNTGIGDAMNLGWKLAEAVHGTAPSWLLDSYEGERHPVGAAVLRLTDAFNQLVLGRTKAQRMVQTLAIGALTRVPVGRRFMAGRLSQIGIDYPRASRGDHRMVGKRMPDVDCGGTRLYELLRKGRFVMASTEGVEVERADVVSRRAQRCRTARRGARAPGRLCRVGRRPATHRVARRGRDRSLVSAAVTPRHGADR